MRKTVRRSLVVSAVMAAGIGLTAVPALAGPPYTVSGSPGAVTADSDNTFLDLRRGGNVVATLRCELVTVGATINNGTYNTVPADIGDITSSSWQTCVDDDFGLSFTVSPDHSPAWNLNLTADGPSADVHKGTVSGAVASISGPLCSASFSGNAPGHYDNSGVLTMDPADGTNTLTVTSASCLGIIQAGDVGEFHGDFVVNADPPIQVTG